MQVKVRQIPFKKSEEELRVVYGEVYIPDMVDSDGDVMTSDEIRKMAWKFMEKSLNHKLDFMHNQTPMEGIFAVESFIARKGDPDFTEGAWVLGSYVGNDEIWEQIKKGEINGYSFQANLKKTPKVVQIEIDKEISGDTLPSSFKSLNAEIPEHTHKFHVEFNEDGDVVGGMTDKMLGHEHSISQYVHTDESFGHSHRYLTD